MRTLHLRIGPNAPLVLQKLLVHGFAHHHLLVELDQELLSLLTAHLIHLGLKGSQIKLLLQGELHRFVHGSTPEREQRWATSASKKMGVTQRRIPAWLRLGCESNPGLLLVETCPGIIFESLRIITIV